MSENELFGAIGDISDALILEADEPPVKLRRLRACKVIALAATICALLGASVFAATVLRGGIDSHSSKIPTYYRVPDSQRLEHDIGMRLRAVEAFSNGYRFKSGHIVHHKLHDTDGTVIEETKGLNCKYQFGGNVIYLDVDKPDIYGETNGSEVSEVYKGEGLSYYSYLNKIVPGNYELTEQDKEDEANGKYVFSFGSSGGIELKEVQIVTFEYGELSYSLCAINSTITEDGLLQMAKEIIDNQN